ncbi:MAG: N-acetylmuramoyl-L-alanine amidase [Lachnospiraceae bacterium]|nr:N-acetylmuramoyl-L-alanine amidase [Lachnospiraceae bacterium]
MNKYLTAAALLVLLLVCLCACGKKSDDEDIHKYKKVGKYDADINDQVPTAGESDLEPPEQKPGTTATPTNTPKPKQQYVVVLDPGHGGNQPGASYDGRVEKTLNLKLAMLVRDYLTTHYDNITVYMTREEDMRLSSDLGEDLRKRVEIGVEKNADILVSLHLNASDGHDQHGSLVCVSKQPNVAEGCRQLAECILKRLEGLGLENHGTLKRNSNDTFDDNGVPVDYYAINRHGAANNLIAVIVETCYIDNSTDAKYLQTDDALQRLAAAEAEGIVEFLDKYYKSNKQ